MKSKYRLHITGLILLAMIALALMSGCSPFISGSGILSKEQVKGHEIVTLKVAYFDAQNRLKSPEATLNSENTDDEALIDEFRQIVSKSKGTSIEGEDQFSPVSDSSHHIEATLDNDYELEFYFSQENNWLIWSHISEEDGQKTVEYHFLTPKASMEDWLSKVKP